MSREDAQSFLNRLERDAALRQAATKAAAGHFAERLVALGAEQGLSFTAGELTAACSEQRPATASGELSDPDLQSVAGGVGSRSLFDTLTKVMERYDQSAKNVIRNMRG